MAADTGIASVIPAKAVAELSGHQGAVRAVRFNRDGNYCVTCGSDKTVKLWNPNSGLLIKTYVGHGQEVLDADSSYDNSRLVSGGADRTILIADVSTGKVIKKYHKHSSRVNCVKFNSDATLVVSGSYDATVRIWDCRARGNDSFQILTEAKDSVPSLQLSKQEILTGSVDGKVRRYDIRMGQLYCDTIGAPVTSVSFSRDDQCVLASTLDNKIRLFDKDTGELLNDYKGHKNEDYKLDSLLSHTDAHVVSGSENGKIYFWDLVEGALVHTVNHSKSTSDRECIVYSISHHPRHPCLLSASSYGPVTVWKPHDWEPNDKVQ